MEFYKPEKLEVRNNGTDGAFIVVYPPLKKNLNIMR
jgi:hypothetical protein